ncbi:MAG TPA: ABC transporter permease subunit [Solirubrobacteraceae bacterium]|jgi:ABC-2 type transport system permease protein|nr:ABC transporter permease subunit [Solirubrobacteraceae bacterium]
MSAAAAAPAAPPAVRRTARRPPVRTVYGWELRKLASQKRTYLGFGLAILLPLIFVISQLIRGQPPRGADNVFASEIFQSGLATPVLMLTFLAPFFLPLIGSLVAGDIVAAEDNNGTLKTILTRSVDRGQVFAAKVLAACTYGASAVFLSAIVGVVAGVGAWGFHSVRTFSGSTVSASEALALVFAAYACFLIPLLTIVCIGVLLSTATRNSAAAIVATLGVTLVLFIVQQIPGLEGLHPYLLTQQYFAWQGLLRTPTDWAPILHSLWLCALYAGPSLFAGYLVFLRRDVAGG